MSKIHCWQRLHAHSWGPWKLDKEDRGWRLWQKVCLTCGWSRLKWEWKNELY